MFQPYCRAGSTFVGSSSLKRIWKAPLAVGFIQHDVAPVKDSGRRRGRTQLPTERMFWALDPTSPASGGQMGPAPAAGSSAIKLVSRRTRPAPPLPPWEPL